MSSQFPFWISFLLCNHHLIFIVFNDNILFFWCWNARGWGALSHYIAILRLSFLISVFHLAPVRHFLFIILSVTFESPEKRHFRRHHFCFYYYCFVCIAHFSKWRLEEQERISVGRVFVTLIRWFPCCLHAITASKGLIFLISLSPTSCTWVTFQEKLVKERD